jgi:hypothetical protein
MVERPEQMRVIDGYRARLRLLARGFPASNTGPFLREVVSEGGPCHLGEGDCSLKSPFKSSLQNGLGQTEATCRSTKRLLYEGMRPPAVLAVLL